MRVLKATVERRYRDKESNWKSSGSFNKNEIPLAIYCLEKAFEKLIEMWIGKSSEDGVVEEEVPL